MQKISEIEQHLLFFIDFLRVPKYRVRPIVNVYILCLPNIGAIDTETCLY